MENQYIYCNCLEGLEQSLERKSPFIETDMILTSDSQLVCSHGWKKKTYNLTGVPYPAGNAVMSYDTFMNTKIQGKFTTIDARKIVNTMKKNPKLLVELDLRTLDRKTAKKTCEKIIDVFEHRSDLLHRLLIQVGSPEMYAGIDNVYHFPYYQYFIHKEEAVDPQPVIDFCVKKGIISVAIKDTYFSPELQSLCRRNGICMLVYTIDDPLTAKAFLSAGVDTICSNFLTLEELS
ncbi:MAG: glycerophosphodiester phosphodiesterase family protein [Oliverpabstia sp.]